MAVSSPSRDDSVVLDGSPLTIAEVEQVARLGRRVEYGLRARMLLTQSREALEATLAAGQTIYGVNTGFGSLAKTRIGPSDIEAVQKNVLRSHAAGVGEPLPEEVVRAMLLILVAALGRGFSGVRPRLAEGIVALLNHRITPVVPSIGSVGASGDLAPLAHAALVLIGEGEATVNGQRMRGGEALKSAGLEPIDLRAKEGLGLINGTHLMAAQAALVLADVERLVTAALCAAAMSIDACRGTDTFLDKRVHEIRGQVGQIEVARRVDALIAGSQIIPSHLHEDPRVQDPYSLRCTPQVVGAALDLIGFARAVVERELGAVTDNPLIFVGGSPEAHRCVSAGNFHGMPLAVALDTLAIALSHVAGISERRVFFILSASDAENRLNPYLTPQPGLHSGLMIVQYTAAACCNELVGLATPASVVNFPTSAGMEDYNSFGARSAAKARRAVDLAISVVAIELLCATEAMEYQRPLRSGPGVEAAHSLVRSVVTRLTADRPPAPDIKSIEDLIRAGRFSA